MRRQRKIPALVRIGVAGVVVTTFAACMASSGERESRRDGRFTDAWGQYLGTFRIYDGYWDEVKHAGGAIQLIQTTRSDSPDYALTFVDGYGEGAICRTGNDTDTLSLKRPDDSSEGFLECRRRHTGGQYEFIRIGRITKSGDGLCGLAQDKSDKKDLIRSYSSRWRRICYDVQTCCDEDGTDDCPPFAGHSCLGSDDADIRKTLMPPDQGSGSGGSIGRW